MQYSFCLGIVTALAHMKLFRLQSQLLYFKVPLAPNPFSFLSFRFSSLELPIVQAVRLSIAD